MQPQLPSAITYWNSIVKRSQQVKPYPGQKSAPRAIKSGLFAGREWQTKRQKSGSMCASTKASGGDLVCGRAAQCRSDKTLSEIRGCI